MRAIRSLIVVSHTFSIFEFKDPPPLWSSKQNYHPKIESPYQHMNIKLEYISKFTFLIKVNNKIKYILKMKLTL